MAPKTIPVKIVGPANASVVNRSSKDKGRWMMLDLRISLEEQDRLSSKSKLCKRRLTKSRKNAFFDNITFIRINFTVKGSKERLGVRNFGYKIPSFRSNCPKRKVFFKAKNNWTIIILGVGYRRSIWSWPIKLHFLLSALLCVMPG